MILSMAILIVQMMRDIQRPFDFGFAYCICNILSFSVYSQFVMLSNKSGIVQFMNDFFTVIPETSKLK